MIEWQEVKEIMMYMSHSEEENYNIIKNIVGGFYIRDFEEMVEILKLNEDLDWICEYCETTSYVEVDGDHMLFDEHCKNFLKEMGVDWIDEGDDEVEIRCNGETYTLPLFIEEDEEGLWLDFGALL